MRHLKKIALLLLIPILTSCGAGQNIQDFTYVVAIGIDYDKEKKDYVIYTMALDFSGVAKPESAKPTGPSPVWIGKSSGKTLSEARAKLQRSSQPQLYLRHVRTILLSEEVLQSRFLKVTQELGRLDFFRQTNFILGTKESIPDIFTTHGLFFYPPLYTILLKPRKEDTESLLKHFTYREFISQFYEPVGASYVPSIGLDDKWSENKSPYKDLTFNGAYFYENQTYQGYKSVDKIKGIRWREHAPMKNTYILGEKENPHTVVKVKTSRMDIQLVQQKDKPIFDVSVKGEADILESIQNVSEAKIKEDIEELIHEEINQSFQEGLTINSDVLRLGIEWFRLHKGSYLDYIKKSNPNTLYLDENSLRNIKVTINLHSSYNYKLKTRSNIWDQKSIYSK
ncbi:Ger(x)C family spore germination C-terminal domain-containing protein [Mesobacillus sp. AQ2]|uniref:Ger(x)C family spore germination protein n=1 Tax=Bacillaceae TaxID=186817 RepID=UPI0016426DFC|nr:MULTISPECIES: Ger(x)C family spore germination C-terminal domain-containing protein [Bacillaceae]WHX42737.1 Ger(x)C family spore germination C-terminal domain-containing protein [Mesobacillus sp. AQ2]